jgi:hypothetical protein
VPHHSRLYKIVIDVPAVDHADEVSFWRAAAGVDLEQEDGFPEYHHGTLPGQDFWLLVQRLDDGAARVHLDIHTDDLAAEVARLEGLGAKRVREVNDWWIMIDPAGLPFCVLPQPAGTLDDRNATRWD